MLGLDVPQRVPGAGTDLAGFEGSAPNPQLGGAMRWNVTADLNNALESAKAEEVSDLSEDLFDREEGTVEGSLDNELAEWLREIAFLKSTQEGA
jgi:hypothetical protein